MKIHINEDESLNELEITISCARITEDIDRIISTLRILDKKLTGSKGGQTYILDAAKILYADTIDKKTFFYTEAEVYESSFKLYELEENLSAFDFVRAGKSCIINFNHIKALRPDIGGKLQITMDNDEKIMASRQYASGIKRKLGVK